MPPPKLTQTAFDFGSLAVPGYPGLLATADGRLLSARTRQPRALRDDHRGYLQVTVTRADGRRVTMKAHTLVALAYHGPPPAPGCLVRHKNGRRHDIRPANLEWGTHSQNMADRHHHGTTARGERNGAATLTAAQVRAIRAATGSLRAIARQFGVHHSTVERIRKGATWQAVRT